MANGNVEAEILGSEAGVEDVLITKSEGAVEILVLVGRTWASALDSKRVCATDHKVIGQVCKLVPGAVCVL